MRSRAPAKAAIERGKSCSHPDFSLVGMKPRHRQSDFDCPWANPHEPGFAGLASMVFIVQPGFRANALKFGFLP
ncbi:MAG: hypothetical protein LUP91_16300, partial [Methylococcaceae bacterium]|nr:hypothetical protein [Methylococcaceae bacterium]